MPRHYGMNASGRNMPCKCLQRFPNTPPQISYSRDTKMLILEVYTIPGEMLGTCAEAIVLQSPNQCIAISATRSG